MLEDKSLRWAHVGSFQSCPSVMNTHSALNTLPVCDDLPWLSTSCWREKKVTRNDSFPLGSQPILASLPMPRTQELSASQAAPVLPFTQPTQSQRGSCPNNTLQTRIYIFNTRRCHTGDRREDDELKKLFVDEESHFLRRWMKRTIFKENGFARGQKRLLGRKILWALLIITELVDERLEPFDSHSCDGCLLFGKDEPSGRTEHSVKELFWDFGRPHGSKAKSHFFMSRLPRSSRRFAVAFSQLDYVNGSAEHLEFLSSGLVAHPCCIIHARESGVKTSSSNSFVPPQHHALPSSGSVAFPQRLVLSSLP